MKYYDGHRFLAHIRNYIEQIGIYLKKHFFTHGQLYVAMSRVGSKERLKILTEQKDDQEVYASNVVYKEVLRI